MTKKDIKAKILNPAMDDLLNNSHKKYSGLYSSFYFSTGEPDEFLMEFFTLTDGFLPAYHILELDTFDPKGPKAVYAVGYDPCEVFGPIVYAIVKKRGIECLRKKLLGKISFLHLKKIKLYSELAEKGMKKVGFDSEEKVQEYLRGLRTEHIRVLDTDHYKL